MGDIGKLLIQIGSVLIFIGIVLVIFSKFPIGGKFPLGRLPGDIYIEKPGFKFYFPWVTCLLISVLFSLIFYLFRK